MKKRRFFALFLVLGLLVSLLSVPASAFEEIDVDARAALLVEKETGEILYEKNAHEKNYPASITKLTVALLVFEAIDAGQLSLDQPITAHESAFEGLSIYGSTAGIKAGEVLTVEQLLQCMLIVSANEACNIFGETLYGSVDAFVARMNERAAELGCAVAKRDVYETLELREPEAGEDTVELSASAMGSAPMSFANSQSGEGEIGAMLDELAAAKTKDIEPLLKRFEELGKITDTEKYADALQSLYDDVLKLSNGGENEAKAMEKILRESIENGKN